MKSVKELVALVRFETCRRDLSFVRRQIKLIRLNNLQCRGGKKKQHVFGNKCIYMFLCNYLILSKNNRLCLQKNYII